MSLQIIDLNRAQYVKLDDGTLADSHSLHELKRRIAKMDLPVGKDAGKQEIILALYDLRNQQELDARRHPAKATA